MNYSIRQATLTDLPALRTLWRDFITDLSPAYPTNALNYLDTFTRQLAQALAAIPAVTFAFLAVDPQDEPIGFLLYEIMQRAFGDPQRFVYVHFCHVIQPRRREGIAAALAEIASEHALAQGLEHVEITHHQDQTAWDALGFTRFDVRSHTTLAMVLARIDKRRARHVMDQANGLDHDAPLTAPVKEEETHG